MKAKTLGTVILCSAILLGTSLLANAALGQVSAPAAQSTDNDVAALKAQLAEQQKQIDALKSAMEEQKKLIERPPAPPRPRSRARTALRCRAIRRSVRWPAPRRSFHPLRPIAAPRPQWGAELPAEPPPIPATDLRTNAVPPYLRFGSTCLVPIGFMDATIVWRDKNAASSIGSNFGSVPYNNTVNGKLSEFRFSPQNSRIGFRFDGDWKGDALHRL